ncbi:RHS repeat domain-containing protein [Chitinophaga parva]|uniref:RHS repeat domain-containing protein n=1 Tax=Chitinophaga parva TaxID=2169414 RepID=UPI001401F250|nr:RHS repeat-associated core domain-containing protein [Chitinophaga parva]
MPSLIKILLLLLPAVSFMPAYGQYADGPSVRSKLDGAAGQLAADSVATTQDSIYFNASLAAKLDTPYHVKNLVNFSINEYSRVLLPVQFTASVQLRIYYLRPDNVQDSMDQTLTINYDTAQSYTQRNSFVFNDAHQVKVKVLQVTAPSQAIAALQVENVMLLYPVFKISCTDDAVKAVYNNGAANTDSTDELLVNWPAVTGINKYDLEWSYIDSTALQSGRYGPAPYDAQKIFAYNGSRVTIAGNSYAIPLMYDDGGVLFYRVRGVQERAGNFNRVETAWSSDYSSGLGAYAFCGHQRNLNWQSTATYAEDGKRKVVVNYFDGSLRSRQMVTKDNTTNTTVVAESLYDYQGRPTIQVLPAPTLNTVIKYTRNLNQYNGAEYDKSVYDHVADAIDYLNGSAPAMDSTSGTNQYYSLNNPEKDNGVNRFIPQANGYAFSQTEYTPDNTGRISRQGGVGKTFQLGSGHETKYYWAATPTQEELYALFGTEVGDRTHYFKNMAIDANGQASVSYVDMHGRTIATGLSGLASNTSLSPVSDTASEVVTDSLSGANQVLDLALTSTQSEVVAKEGNYHFTYELAPPVLKRLDCNNNEVCYTGLYDLEIKITDDVYNQHLGGAPVVKTFHNYDAAGIIPDCNPQPIQVSFDINLPVGSYTITKTLTISKQGLEYYRDSVFSKSNVCTTLDQQISQQRDFQLQNQCVPDCQSCRDSLGTWEQFRVNYVTRAGGAAADSASYRDDAWLAYQTAMSECDDLCNLKTEVDDIRAAMLLDVTAPSGQYAQVDDSSYAYSIFYHKGPNDLPPYRNPNITYLDEYGHAEQVYDDNINMFVKPQQLDPVQFAAKFKGSWANALLPSHPEYCKLTQYEGFRDSQNWDKAFEAVDTYGGAIQKGFLNPTGNAAIPFTIALTDSLVLDHPGFKALMEARLQPKKDTPSMWSTATISVKCGMDDLGCHVQYDSPASAFDANKLCGGDLDMAWRNFRSAYLNAKRKAIFAYLESFCNSAPKAADLIKRKEPRFSDGAAALTQAGYGAYAGMSKAQAEQASSSLSQGTYTQNCQDYATVWTQQLAPCKYSPDDLKELIPLLTKVCMEGADRSHPYGASSVAPSSFYQYRNFDEVLVAFNRTHNITTDPWNCNAELITTPAPYNLPTAVSDGLSYTKPDDCQCGKLQDLVREYNAVKTAADLNLAAYLNRTRGTALIQQDLDVLLDACSGSQTANTCTYLPKPVTIPALLRCDVAPACATCTDINNLYNAFKAQYPSVTPVQGDVDSVQALKNNLFVNYMNSHLGFGKQLVDYLSFMDSCSHSNVQGAGQQVCKPDAGKGGLISTYSNGGTADRILDMRATTDGGYIMAGYTNGCGAGGNDGYIIRSDNEGNVVWSKTFGGLQDDQFNRVVQTHDGGFIVIGTTYSSCYDLGSALIVRLDDSGNELWNRTIDMGADGSSGEDILQSSDTSFTFGGYRISHAAGGLATDWLTGALDADGRLVWMRMLGSAENKKTLRMTLRDDTLVIAASIKTGGTTYDAVVLKENNTTGAYQSLDRYPVEGKDHLVTGLEQVNDGYRLTMGAQDAASGGKVLDVSSTGAVLRVLKVTNGAGTWNATSWLTVTQGTSLLASQSVGGDVYWTKINGDNTVAWTNRVRTPNADYLNAITINGRGNLAGAGAQGNGGMWMLASASGRTGCNDTIATIGVTDVTTSVTRNSGPGLTDTLLTSNYVNALGMSSNICSPFVNVVTCPGMDSCYVVGAGPLLCGNAVPIFPTVEAADISSCSDSAFFALSAGTVIYNSYRDSILTGFEHDYLAAAMEAMSREHFAVTHNDYEYHYTLYYYDQAGNLVKTVPPKGVVKNRSAAWIASVKAAVAAGTALPAPHTMVTQYRYNTLNAVVAQQTPDAGQSHFWYDRLARVAASQNAKQYLTNDYSYTRYDYLGRIAEVGQLKSSTAMTDLISRNGSALDTWINNVASSKEQITVTNYDLPHTPLEGYLWSAENLRNRVSWSAVYNTGAQLAGGYDRASATYYSYDVHGNVKELLQEFNSGMTGDNSTLGHYKKIAYNYDLISGKVNTVSFNPGQPDAYYHRYSYDAENRITDVETSRDSLFWDHDAFYQYYKYGTLARTVLGQQQVQGMDYAYTLQGWIKGVNGTSLGGSFEMGGDGATTAKDAFGYALHYYGAGDYKPIGDVRPFAEAGGSNFKPLYNGNIGAMSVNLPKVGEPLQYNYSYDLLNRIVGMQTVRNLDVATNTWTPVAVSDFGENVTYDPNGNILTYNRNGNATWAGKSLDMDKMHYNYVPGSNKLDNIKDDVDPNAYTEDIDGQADGNYEYDAIGNLVKDQQSSIDEIRWTVYGKISDIHKTNGDGTTIHYTYDVSGNRISKTVNGVLTWYVRDATGNVMSIYTRGDNSVNGGHLTQTETGIYGSSRLGVEQGKKDLEQAAAGVTGSTDSGLLFNFPRGQKMYEVGNHLGNVLATVGDVKLPESTDNVTVTGFEPKVRSAQDYYPFGMQEPGRIFSNAVYRYGFNGKENDNEVKGEGDQQDYGMRFYDPRVGKFLSIDPLTRSYPMLTPYQYASNGPIENVDLDGLEKYHYTFAFDATGHTVVKLANIEHFSEWQWKPAVGGTALGFQLFERIQDPRKEYIVEYKFRSILQVEFTAVEADQTLTATFGTEKDALNATWDDFHFSEAREQFAKGLAAGAGGGSPGRLFRRSWAPHVAEPMVAHLPEEGITLKEGTPQVGKMFKSYKATIQDGKISMVNSEGRLVNTNGRYDFVITNDGTLLIGTGHYQMSGEAETVRAAGQIKLRNGSVVEVTNSSGHYKPSISEGNRGVGMLEQMGVNMNSARVTMYNSDGTINTTKKNGQ